jgi:pimeloyl-ACP methyl ester carboxylesterase
MLAFEAGRPPGTATAQAPALEWSDCGGGFECATLAVPLDYAQPAGRAIDIALVRMPARKPEERIGALLSNPGGPGASGINFMRGWTRAVDGDIRDRFDLVSFDPRGVGQSTPLLCHDDIQKLLALDPEPATDDEWAEVRSALQQFADLCAQRGADLLPHLGSLDVVQDMDRIRAALGEQQITYVGYSYGTVLGALYAEEFPQRVRAMVLDGPVDLSLTPDELNLEQAEGFEQALDHFIEDCRERQCVLAQGGRDPAAAIDELRERAREQPIPSSNADRPAGPGETLTAIVSALYRKEFWPSLANAIEQGLDGDGSWLVQMTDGLWGRHGDDYSNLFEVNTAVNCLDYTYAPDLAHYEELAKQAAAVAPRFGASIGATGLVCSLWPAPSNPVGVPEAADAPPLLVVGTTGDPATPFGWALATRRDLVTSTLLTREGEGHTAYVGGNHCIDGIVNAYLLTLARPEDGAICGTDAEPRAPATPPASAFPPRGSAAQVTVTPVGTAVTAPAARREVPDSGGGVPWLWLGIGMGGLVIGFATAITTVRLRHPRR